MGKCSIISHDGDGLYTVQMLPDFSLIETDIAKLDATLLDIDNVELINLEAAYLEAKGNTDAAKSASDSQIAIYATDPTPENFKLVNDSIEVLGEAVVKESESKIPYDAIKARRLGILKRIAKLSDAISIPIPIQVWCADLSDGLKARSLYALDDVVGTIEILGNSGNGINLQPYYDKLGLYLNARDGSLVPTASLTPASYFYNRTMIPSWQKWQTLYRPGVIIGAAGGGFEVSLDLVKSHEQFDFIPVNDLDDGATLTGIHAEYMNCNDAAFTAGDAVVVKSTYDVDRNRTDVIVGFIDNPQPCDVSGFNYQPNVVGGPSPGLKDWQNLQSDGGTGWVMRTPMLTDLIADGGGFVYDWKGYLSGGEKILVQWADSGPTIYVDTLKTAVLPNFTLTPVAGDTSGPLIPSGFDAAWITSDNQYIYAIPREASLSRHVLRKTTNVELTGNVYNATTDPDGWEVSTAFGQATGGYFIRFGIPKVNQSGTEARSMDDWTHGAKRAPQVNPGAGAVWRSNVSYDNQWLEESQLTITTPSAATIAGAGISYQFNGLIGGFVYNEEHFEQQSSRFGELICPGWDFYKNGIITNTTTNTYSGSYAVAVGYQNDVVGYLNINGDGVYFQQDIKETDTLCVDSFPENVFTQTRSGTTPVDGAGTKYKSDFEAWDLPHNVRIITTDTINGVGNNCDDWVLNTTLIFDGITGEMPEIDVTNGIYRHIEWDRYYNDVSILTGSGNCEGVRTNTTRITEEGTVELGTTQQQHSKIISDVLTVTDPWTYVIPSFIQTVGFTYDPGDDPQVITDTSSTTKYNETGAISRHGDPDDLFNSFFYARDFDDNFISSYTHTYSIGGVTEYEDYLTNGDLSTLDELDNGTGTQYLDTHVAN